MVNLTTDLCCANTTAALQLKSAGRKNIQSLITTLNFSPKTTLYLKRFKKKIQSNRIEKIVEK